MQNSEYTKLNVGCGAFRKKGFLNVDISDKLNPDLIHDLDQMPYPFPDNAFEHIEADHVLEHLSDPFKAMEEWHRILKNGGSLIVRVPHFSRGFTHADHKRGFDVSFPYYFKKTFQGGYTGIDFEIEKIRLTWCAQPYLKKTLMPGPLYGALRGIGFVMDAFANLSPFVCSRLWCYWVGGFEEVMFCFRAVKTDKTRPCAE